MAFTRYDATVRNYLQALDSVSGFLARGLVYFKEQGVDPAEIVETRLAPAMLRHQGVPLGKRDFLGRMRMKA